MLRVLRDIIMSKDPKDITPTEISILINSKSYEDVDTIYKKFCEKYDDLIGEAIETYYKGEPGVLLLFCDGKFIEALEDNNSVYDILKEKTNQIEEEYGKNCYVVGVSDYSGLEETIIYRTKVPV